MLFWLIAYHDNNETTRSSFSLMVPCLLPGPQTRPSCGSVGTTWVRWKSNISGTEKCFWFCQGSGEAHSYRRDCPTVQVSTTYCIVTEKDWKYPYYPNFSLENNIYTTKSCCIWSNRLFCLIISLLSNNQAVYYSSLPLFCFSSLQSSHYAPHSFQVSTMPVHSLVYLLTAVSEKDFKH